MHEVLPSNEVRRPGSDKSFGWTFTAVFALYGCLPLRKGGSVRVWALGISCGFLLVTLIRPEMLHRLNRAWMQLGYLLGRVVNPIVTGVLFFLLVSPVGLLLRLFGKDSLRLRWDPAMSSYWIERHPPGPAPSTMSNQF